MASPKSKISRSIRGSRRSHNSLKAPTVNDCANCGSLVKPHQVCPSCGQYKGKEIVPARD